MYFKMKPWDLLPELRKNLSSTLNVSPIFFSSFDLYITRILEIDLIEFFSLKSYPVILGNEITFDWIENNLQAPSLFDEGPGFIVKHAELISGPVKNYLLESSSWMDSKRWIFFFYQEDKFFHKWLGQNEDQKILIEIISPPFWEMEFLVDFICSKMGIKMQRDALEWIVDYCVPTCFSYISLLNQIKLEFPLFHSISLSDVQGIQKRTKLDSFELAFLFSKREFIKFYQELLSVEIDSDHLRSFFVFMKGHLLKLADPSYLSQKKKLVKYDQRIQDCSKLWRKAEILQAIKTFSQWEVMAKSKDEILIDKIRLKYLNALKT